MPRLKVIGWTALGFALSTALLACAPRVAEAPAPQVIVREVRETPPAEIVRCPTPPEGLPADQVATLPAPLRQGVIRLALYAGGLAAQLNRNIAWSTGEACPGLPGIED